MNRSLLDKTLILAPLQRKMDDGELSQDDYMDIMEWVYDDSISTPDLHQKINERTATPDQRGSEEVQGE